MNKAIFTCAFLCLAAVGQSSRGELVVEAEKLFSSQLKLTLRGVNALCVLEQSTNSLNFSPMQLCSGQAVVASTQQFAAFRAEQLSLIAASYCQRAAID